MQSNLNNICLVDDESDILIILRKSFEREGFTVVTFDDPTRALQYILNCKDRYIVITDIRMPQMSGIEFVDLVKQTKPNTIIIVLSAFPKDNVKINADEFLEKPIPFKKLHSIVTRIVGEKT